MTDIENKPSLRISPNVYGRTGVKNKVMYLLDPKGEGTAMGVPEKVVLTRWRKRIYPDHVFSGAKLSSTLWRAVAAAFGKNTNRICKLSREEIANIKLVKNQELKAMGFLVLPAAETLEAIFAICGPERLKVLLDRHTSKAHQGHSGVPDLFLYATRKPTGRPSIARFVEVKKPKEPVSSDQKEEIALLNAMGLHARVMRLVEK